MLSLREVEEAIRDLENSSATYNNCMKLASLYVVRDELRQRDSYGQSSYGYRPYYPMYERGGRGSSSSYGYRRPMYYTEDDLMIKKDHMPMQSEMYTQDMMN